MPNIYITPFIYSYCCTFDVSTVLVSVQGLLAKIKVFVVLPVR